MAKLDDEVFSDSSLTVEKVVENGITYDVRTNQNGSRFYSKEGSQIVHREGDLPAIEYANGDRFYYIDGQLHREGGPAKMTEKGNFYYYKGQEVEASNDKELTASIKFKGFFL